MYIIIYFHSNQISFCFVAVSISHMDNLNGARDRRAGRVQDDLNLLNASPKPTTAAAAAATASNTSPTSTHREKDGPIKSSKQLGKELTGESVVSSTPTVDTTNVFESLLLNNNTTNDETAPMKKATSTQEKTLAIDEDEAPSSSTSDDQQATTEESEATIRQRRLQHFQTASSKP